MEYKKYHEAQIANHSGSTVLEIELLLSLLPFGIFLLLWLKCFNFMNAYLNFLFEFLFIVLPIICKVTILSEFYYMISLSFFLIIGGLIIMYMNPLAFNAVLSSEIKHKKPFFTYYRSSTNLVSALCILAVDFSIFPRRFAKTENFGFGLMDLGVGYFICSNGIVTKSINSQYRLSKVVKSCLVLMLLGFLRLFLVKCTNYHEHVSEYGVHWNFFFTLALCKIVSFLIRTGSCIQKPLYLAVLCGVIHQFLLYNGLQQWVLSDLPRDTFLLANREGISSIPGYVSLYFASVALGQIINNSDCQITYQKLIAYLLVLSFGTWTFTGVCYFTIGISRRLVNGGYIFWTIASTINVLMQFIFIDLLINSMNEDCKNIKKLHVFQLMESINSNGLLFFLVSNLFTGLINISCHPFLLSPISGFILILIYMLVICGFSKLLFSQNLILKF